MEASIRKKLGIRLIWIILAILIMNYASLQFYWYSSVWWLDMPMHFLGGIWAALAIFWIFSPKSLNTKHILAVMLGVLCIGLAWEIFEIVVNDAILKNPFNSLDTLSDIFFDLAGALLGIFYLLGKIRREEAVKI